MKCSDQYVSLFSDIHIEQTERTAIEPVESPVRHEHISKYNSTSGIGIIYHDLIFSDHQIHNRPGESIDVIDLTQDSDEDSNHPDASEIHSNGVVSPVTIDLTTEADNEGIERFFQYNKQAFLLKNSWSDWSNWRQWWTRR